MERKPAVHRRALWRAGTIALGATLSLTGSYVRARPLDFKQSVALALKGNPAMTESSARIAQARAGVREARGRGLPRLTASAGVTRTDDPLGVFGSKLMQGQVTAGDFDPARLNNPGAYNNFNTRLQLDIPVYSGGLTVAEKARAQALLGAARSGDKAARAQLTFEVLKGYEGVRAARAYEQVARQALTAARSTFTTTRQLVTEGAAIRSDLLTARVTVEDARVQEQQARDGAANALTRFRILLGLPPDASADVGPAVLPPMPSARLNELERRAVADNPGLAALRRRLVGSAEAVAAARAAYRPHFNVVVSQDWNDPHPGLQSGAYSVGGVVTWQVFDFGTRGGAVDAANARRIAAQARLRQAEDSLRVEVAQTYRRALAAQLDVNSKTLAVAEADEAQRLLILRHKNGVTTTTDLLAGQARLDRTRAELVNARYELAVARASLLLALGHLDVPTVQGEQAASGGR